MAMPRAREPRRRDRLSRTTKMSPPIPNRAKLPGSGAGVTAKVPKFNGAPLISRIEMFTKLNAVNLLSVAVKFADDAVSGVSTPPNEVCV